MTNDAISLMVHRKDDQLMVTPWAISSIGFRCLDDVYIAEPGHGGLVHALELAAARAREATALPRDQRFGEPGVPYWKRSGFSSEKEFVTDSRAVSVLMSAKRTQLQSLVPMKDSAGMAAKDPPKELEPGISMDEIARAVIGTFNAHS